MASSSMFTRAVVNSMRKLYPEELADKSFDNTGLLLEAPERIEKKQKNSVLLTVDLTKNVVDEAIKSRHSIIISYHPIIFRGLKSITCEDTQQLSLLRLAQEGISVYCPHTAVDAAIDGLGDWLADIVVGKYVTAPRKVYRHSRKVIKPVMTKVPDLAGAGTGRIVTFQEPITFKELGKNIMHGLKLQYVSVAIPDRHYSHNEIRTVGVCAGSGASVFQEISADALLTGEMSHHDALAFKEKGTMIFTTHHSKSERGYLRIMAEKLREQIPHEMKALAPSSADGEADSGPSFEVDVSSNDRDPYQTVESSFFE